MFTADEIKQICDDRENVEETFVSPELSEIEDALNNTDQSAIKNSVSERLEWEKWNGQDINGKTEEEMRKLKTIPSGSTPYLIKNAETGNIIVFQPFKPHVSDREPITDVESTASKHTEEIAERIASSEIIGTVLEKTEQ